jgi:multisubunit Na+/H+ antiporter MnhG subunit
MCAENIYEKITEEYIKRRNESIRKEWSSLKSFYKRAKGKENEFKRLKESDIEFQKNFASYAKKYFTESIFKIDEAKEYLLFLENHVMKLHWRFSSVTISLGVFGGILGFIGLSRVDDILSWLKHHDAIEKCIAIVSVILVGTIITFAYQELIELKKYEFAYKEFLNILKNIIGDNDTEKK